jgi:hypothetical protein
MTTVRGLIAVALVILVMSVITQPEHAGAGVEYFPVPAASTSKNDGSEGGLIVPILFTDPDGDLRYIVAPMLINNSYLGARGTLNIFRYDPGGREIRFTGSYTEHIERKLAFSYADPAFSQGRYSLNFGASYFKNATARFFGLGQATSESAETNYTGREARVNWRFGVHVNEVTQIAVGQRFRDVRLQRGGVDLPFTGDQFSSVDGVQGETLILGHRATFYYDTRNNLVSPTDGMAVTAYAELNRNARFSSCVRIFKPPSGIRCRSSSKAHWEDRTTCEAMASIGTSIKISSR